MLTNIAWFFGGILFYGVIVFFAKRREQKEKSDLMLVSFETKNGCIKATVINGPTYWSNTVAINTDSRNWWQENDKNKKGRFEECLTHLYCVKTIKENFNATPIEPKEQKISKPIKLN